MFKMRRAGVDEADALSEMDARSFAPGDRIVEWDDYVTFWITLAESNKEIGLIALFPNMFPGRDWELANKQIGTVWLTDIVVDSEYRKWGAAQFAVEWAVQWAKARGFSKMVSNFRVSNHASCRLHEKCGFKYAGIIPEYYHDPVEDAVLVERV